MANAPIAKVKDFGISAAIFEWVKDGKKSYSISLQRSYKKKDATEYTNETINMYPEDLLKTANVLMQTYNAYVALSFSKKSETKPQANGWSETNTDLSDDSIPF